MRLDIRRIETLKEGTEAIGNRVRVKVVKNKVAPPFKQAEFDIIYGHGISWEGTVLDVGLERKIVSKSGSYFSFGDERLGQGRQNATAFLQEHPDLVQSILARIQVEAGPEQVVSARLLPQATAGDVETPAAAEVEEPSGRGADRGRGGELIRGARGHRHGAPPAARPRRRRARRSPVANGAGRGRGRSAPDGRLRARPRARAMPRSGAPAAPCAPRRGRTPCRAVSTRAQPLRRDSSAAASGRRSATRR